MTSKFDAFGRIVPRRTRSFSHSPSPERSPRRRNRFSDSEDDEPRKRGRHGRRRSMSASPDPRRRRSPPIRRRGKPRGFSPSRSRSSSPSSSPSRSRSRRRPRHGRKKRTKSQRSYSRTPSPSPVRKRHRRRSTSRRSYSPSPSPSPKRRKRSRYDRTRRGDDAARRPQLTYKQFLYNQPENISPEEAQKKYEQYKNEYSKSNIERFFDLHKGEEWFQEKYDPVKISEKRQKQMEIAQELSKDFYERFINGEIKSIDDNVEEEEVVNGLDNVKDEPKEDESQEGESQVVDMDETDGLKDEPQQEDGVSDVEQDEDMGDANQEEQDESKSQQSPSHDVNQDKANGDDGDIDIDVDQGDLGKPSSVDVDGDGSDKENDNEKDASSEKGEEEIEEIDEEEAAGRARGESDFEESDSKMAGGDENANIPGKSEPPRKEKILLKFEDNAIFIQSIPLSATRQSLIDVFKKSPGYVKLVLSDPLQKQRNNRYGWVTFQNQEQCESALNEFTGYRMGSYFLHLMPKRRSTRKSKNAPPIFLHPARIDKDLEIAKDLVKQLDKEKRIEDNMLLECDEFQSLHPNLRALNVLLAYLREVHFFCYYCGKEYFDEEGMMSRCGKMHGRSSRKPSDETDNGVNYITKSLEKRIKERKPPTDNVVWWKERKVEEFIEKNITKIEEKEKVKVRCGVGKCKKMFKGMEFTRKHIHNKHQEFIDSYLERERENDYYGSYENDPDKLTVEQFEQTSTPPATMGPMGGGGPGGVVGGQNGFPTFMSPMFGAPAGGPGIVIPKHGGAPYIAGGMGMAPPRFVPVIPMDMGRSRYNHHRRDYRQGPPPPRPVRSYADLDAAPAEAEQEIDYGFDDMKPKFHL